MSRPKIYPNGAARTAACRARQKREGRARRQEHTTPPDLFAQLDAEFHFSLDVAALPHTALCARFFTPLDDGLAQDWGQHACWMNSPYAQRVIDRWIQKAAESAQAGATVVCLVPARTGAAWWHTWVLPHAAEIRFLRGRQKFSRLKTNARENSAVVIFRPGASRVTSGNSYQK